MTKSVDTCKMCQRNRYVNYAGLCKRCNKDPASQEIKENVMEKRADALEMQQERQEALDAELNELLALEDKGELSDEQATRLEQLRPSDGDSEAEGEPAGDQDDSEQPAEAEEKAE